MLENYLKPGDGVIDIGANEGHYTKQYLDIVGPSGYVLAVEPGAQAFQRLTEWTAGYSTVRLLCAAVGAQHGTATLHHDATATSRHSLYKANVIHDAQASEDVPMVTLDDLAKTVPHLRGIKIDAQGAELEILKGATQTLQDPKIRWFIEIWPMGLTNAGSSSDEVCDVLEAAGLHESLFSWPDRRRHLHESCPNHSSDDLLLTHQSLPDWNRGAHDPE